MSTEDRQSQVGEQMNRLEDSINVAAESLKKLRDRLGPCSRNTDSPSTKCEKAAAIEDLVPFASEIRNRVDKLVTLNDDIQSTILGLEI